MKFAKLSLFLVLGLALSLTGCQKNNQTQAEDVQKKEGSEGFFNFFSFKKGSTTSSTETTKELERINNFLEVEMGTKLEKIIVEDNYKIPLIIRGNYYVYKTPPPETATVFLGGTRIDRNNAVITIKKGGSTDLQVDGFKNSLNIQLGRLFLDPKDNKWKVQPFPFIEEIGTLSAKNKDSLVNRELTLYVCYPIYKEMDLKIRIPPKNDLNPKTKDELLLESIGNNGEIKLDINMDGIASSGNEFLLTITLMPDLNNIKIGEEGELMLANTGLINSCGNPVDPTKKERYPVYLTVVAYKDNMEINLECTRPDGIYDMRFGNTMINCRLRETMEETEKIINLKVKMAYTLVKRLKIEDIGVIIPYIEQK